MPILTSLRQSPTYLYCKVYCVCSIVTLFQAAPLSSRLLSPPNPNPRPRGGGSWGWGWGWGWISRWRRRAADLSGIRAQLARDDVDVRVYPELEWDAEVRRSTRLHADEEAFIRARRARIAHEGGLARFLGVPHHAVDEADVPLIAIGGSGGGHRAMYGFAGFLAAARAHRLWAITTWVAGVSGSCWTLAALYTIARRDMHRLLTHYHAIARQHAHPLSRAALHTVAHSPRGTYFLLAPLLRKATDLRLGLPIPIRIRIMDLYATLTTAFLFLNRHPRARPRLSRHHLQFSKLWTRAHLHKAHHPLPLLTAVRVAPKHKHKHKDASPPGSGFFQWFEISPLEVGCRDVGFVPTWAWGRPFRSGHSLRRQPEHSLALLLGQCTSAPAAPLTAYISALLASLPQGTLISRLLMLLNNFVRMKQWQRRWGNPIRAGDEHNPFYGPETHPPPKQQRGDRGGDRGGGVLGIGVDILHLPRLRALVERRSAGAAHLARRILCRAERDQFGSLPACTEAEAEAKLKWLAVRWAAKEAAYKALYPTFEVRWTDLCIDKPRDARAASPKPRIRFSDEWSRSHRGAEAGPQTPYMHLSVSHDGEYVVANVLAENRPTPPPPPPPPPLPLPPPSPSPSPSPESESESGSGWESGGRIRLMDSGMSNNLPNRKPCTPHTDKETAQHSTDRLTGPGWAGCNRCVGAQRTRRGYRDCL